MSGTGKEFYQQKVDLADDRVLQMVASLVVLELDVEAVLNAHLHLYTARSASDYNLRVQATKMFLVQQGALSHLRLIFMILQSGKP